jgi:hypothetical protein
MEKEREGEVNDQKMVKVCAELTVAAMQKKTESLHHIGAESSL